MSFVRICCVLILVLTISQAPAQPIRIGIIDVYGNLTIPTDTIMAYAAIEKENTISQKDLADRVIERRLEKIKGVRLAQTAVVCCSNNKQYVLFIGVAENDSSIFSYRKAPTLKIGLPEAYTNAYSTFSRRYNDAVLVGQAHEDWSNGYPMIKYPPARRIQEKYLRWANTDFKYLQKIIHSSVYDNQRATAVAIIAYNDDKQKVIPELIYAMKDENEMVRHNAIKALSAISYYLALHPGEGTIPYEPFIQMIKSVIWADRHRALGVLMQLSETRNKELFRQLRESALHTLKEMAQWKSEAHAKPAYVVLARMAGQKEEQISATTSNGNFAAEISTIVDALQ